MKIIVDGTLSWREMYIKAAHSVTEFLFSNTSDLSEKNFPIVDESKRVADIRLHPLKKHYPCFQESIISYLKEYDLRPAYIEEVFAYAREKPQTQESYRLIGAGSKWMGRDGSMYYPCLSKSFLGRYVGLDSLDRALIVPSETKFICVKI